MYFKKKYKHDFKNKFEKKILYFNDLLYQKAKDQVL